MTEVPLGGGNVSGGVVRIGDTVRRPAGPWTPAVHALLGHLHATGFPGAPRPLAWTSSAAKSSPSSRRGSQSATTTDVGGRSARLSARVGEASQDRRASALGR